MFLPRGQYYVDGPLVVGDGVVVRGEAEQLVSIYFREDNPDTSPRPGYIYANASAEAWGVTDLTVYITHHCECEWRCARESASASGGVRVRGRVEV